MELESAPGFYVLYAVKDLGTGNISCVDHKDTPIPTSPDGRRDKLINDMALLCHALGGLIKLCHDKNIMDKIPLLMDAKSRIEQYMGESPKFVGVEGSTGKYVMNVVRNNKTQEIQVANRGDTVAPQNAQEWRNHLDNQVEVLSGCIAEIIRFCHSQNVVTRDEAFKEAEMMILEQVEPKQGKIIVPTQKQIEKITKVNSPVMKIV